MCGARCRLWVYIAALYNDGEITVAGTICVQINGERRHMPKGSVLQNAIEGYAADSSFAVAVNKVLITRAKYDECELKDGDSIDIVYPMQGG
ncbi:MAG: sulfur carrier protein ThiS [Anaplasma sp.]